MRQRSIGCVLALAALWVTGCAPQSSTHASPRRERAVAAPVTEGAHVPSTSTAKATRSADGKSLTQIRPGMTYEQVVAILGPPTEQRSQLTAHAFNPFAVGNQGQVTRFYYEKIGRVVFAGPDYAGGGTAVIAVEEDPHESGHPRE